MPNVTIDNRTIDVPAGATVLDAARQLGVHIPTLCHLQGLEPATSCMVCLVKLADSGKLVPACATPAAEGLRVESETPEVHAARRAALELLLSDHVGDCDGPCQGICPAKMDIPLMIRQISSGNLRQAIATVKREIALPAILGYICPAPCEKGCRRSAADRPLAICLLKRYVAEADLASEQPYLPPRAAATGKRIAIVGSGPAGLAAAWRLLPLGHACTVFDKKEHAGGMLRYGVDESRLPSRVLDAEIEQVRRAGAEFRLGVRVGQSPTLEELRTQFDAVIVAVGHVRVEGERLGLAASDKGIAADARTLATTTPGVFAAGDATGTHRGHHPMAVRAVAAGKAAAESVHQYVSGLPVTGPVKRFSTHIGLLHEGEIETFLAGLPVAAAPPRSRDLDDDLSGEEFEATPGLPPHFDLTRGLSSEQAAAESARCLHCDCRKADHCRLRECSQQYAARPAHYKTHRRSYQQDMRHGEIVFESGKCIDCGLCIRIAEQAGEPLGLAFVGRGFDVRVAVPFGRPLSEALTRVASRCIEACPTGAIAAKNG